MKHNENHYRPNGIMPANALQTGALAALLFIGATFQSCTESTAGASDNLQVSEGMRLDTLEGSCPYLTTANKGNVVLSWIRKTYR